MPSVGMPCLYSSRAAANVIYLRTVTWIATTFQADRSDENEEMMTHVMKII